MRLLFLFLVGLIIPCFGYTQAINEDYYRFGARPSPIPLSLIGFNNQSKEIYFGISDPGLDSATAILQATKRAKAIMAISNGVKVKNLTIGFNTEYRRGNSGTYESMIEIEAISSEIFDAVVIDSAYTSFNEAVVIISPATTKDNEFAFNLNRYLVEYQIGGYSEYSEVLDFYIKDQKTPGETTVYIKSYNNEEVFTEINNETFPLPITHYKYLNPGDSVEQVYRYGLWINALRKLNQTLGEYSRLRTEQVKKMGENYNYTQEKIDEGVSLNRFTFRIKSIQFHDGDVYFDLDVMNK
ncbi:MAG TPA: hypothetical protein PK990_08160 [Salinivirgaceae bacterium]|nr:hypothetical protein [Salinivirgaceae bacterium]